MATPATAPPGEPFAEALPEAVQAAAMSIRLVMAIADAVRRAAQKHHQGEERDPVQETEQLAPGFCADQLRAVLPQDVLGDLMAGADWPVMARQLVGLKQAGVDLATFVPQMGRMAAGVQQAVVANAARTKAQGTERWADMLKETMPQGLVRDAILASPAWPEIAAAMGRLDARGVDVSRVLADAYNAGLGIDQAIAAVTTAAAAPAPGPGPVAQPVPETEAAAARPAPAAPGTNPWAPPAPDPNRDDTLSADTRRVYGPLTEGLALPKNLDLTNRAQTLHKLGVTEAANNHLAMVVTQKLGPEHQRDAALLLSAPQWPLLAARMQRMAVGGQYVEDHLDRLATDTSWHNGPPSQTTQRILLATHRVLTTPLDQPLPAAPRVSTAAARARSTTAPAAPTGTQAPAEPAMPAHRQQTAPAPRQGRGR
ncbi:hypothetical protein ACFYWO_39950 [Streptomyces sp. NPDC002932]|uniref:hypothetical protein n=1 Tax=Streptomyces sp. NPDC002932 TaxID=3364672 RepID=UPI0036AE572C